MSDGEIYVDILLTNSLQTTSNQRVQVSFFETRL
jgi:hypothetical protein